VYIAAGERVTGFAMRQEGLKELHNFRSMDELSAVLYMSVLDHENDRLTLKNCYFWNDPVGMSVT